MTVTYILSEQQTLTPEEIAEVEAAKQIPITYDEDCPALTPETYAAFRRAAAERNLRLWKEAHSSTEA